MKNNEDNVEKINIIFRNVIEPQDLLLIKENVPYYLAILQNNKEDNEPRQFLIHFQPKYYIGKEPLNKVLVYDFNYLPEYLKNKYLNKNIILEKQENNTYRLEETKVYYTKTKKRNLKNH